MEEFASDERDSEITVNDGLKIACPIVGVLLASCAGYVMVSLVIHFVTSMKGLKKLKNMRRIEEGSRRARMKRRGVAKLSSWLGYLSVASSVFAFLNSVVDIPSSYLQEDTSTKTCKILMSFSFIFYPCGVVCVYSFLWARQRVFYSSPSLGLLHSKYLRWTSFAVLPTFLIMTGAGLISTLAIFTYKASDVGCVEISGNNSPTIVLYVGSLVMQCTLLALFVYPLKQHAAEGENELPENKLLMPLMKRACVITAVCVFADTTAFIVIMCLPSDGPSVVVNLIRDGNLLVSVVCIVCSFVDWRNRLAPVCRKGYQDKEENKPGEIRLVKSVKSNSGPTPSFSSAPKQLSGQQPSDVV